MRYFVIGANGELFGPADIATLNQWILEGRLGPTSMIQEELGGARFAASMLKELHFPVNYVHPGHAPQQSSGENEIKTSWILGVVGLVCCSFCAPIGIVFGFIAKSKGHPKATGPIIFCTVVTLISIAWTVYYIRSGGFEGIIRGMR